MNEKEVLRGCTGILLTGNGDVHELWSDLGLVDTEKPPSVRLHGAYHCPGPSPLDPQSTGDLSPSGSIFCYGKWNGYHLIPGILEGG